MAWNFEILADSDMFRAVIARPKAGESHRFEIYGIEDGEGTGAARNGNISVQLSGVTEVRYLDRDEPVIRYTGLSTTNAHTGRAGLRPPGVCESTVIEDLEYVCLLARKGTALFAEVVDLPATVITESHFMVIEGEAFLRGQTIPRLGFGVALGQLLGTGKVLLIRQHDWLPGRVLKVTDGRLRPVE